MVKLKCLEVVKATAYHPFYVAERGWVDAIQLEEKDLLVTEDGAAEIMQIREYRQDEPIETYNFHVEDWCSYFVSEQCVYVHNMEDGHPPIKEILEKARGKTEIILPSKPHTNGTEGHWDAIVEKVDELVDSGEYEKIYVNKGLGNEIPNAKPNRRPDIMAVKPDKTIDQFEVPSKTDTVKGLHDRMTDNQKIIGDRAGSIEVVPIKKK